MSRLQTPAAGVMMTGSEHKSSEWESLRSGADDYLTKPANPDVLRSRMQNLIARSRRRTPHP